MRLFGTGFEGGMLDIFDYVASTNRASIQSTTKKTGSYALKMNENYGASNNQILLPSTYQTLYMSFWAYYESNLTGVGFKSSDGSWIGIGNSGTYATLVTGETVIQTGSKVACVNRWAHYQLYVYCDDTNGVATIKVDGVTEFTYNGDTKRGTPSVFDGIIFYDRGSPMYVDDVVVDDAAYPGDVRFIAAVPTADASPNQWTPSSGTSGHYSYVDETSSPDTEYLYAATNAYKELFDITDFPEAGKTPDCVLLLARLTKDTGDAQQAKLIVSSGGIENTTTLDLTTAWKTYRKFMAVDPTDSAAWTNSKLDALKIGAEAVIP
jgi:hypothetical protein